MKTIYETAFGSHLYGTSTPSSDRDYKGVFIPDARSIVMGTVPHVITNNTKKNNLDKNSNEDIDYELYSLKKYLQLTAEGQTVALDMLFSSQSNMATVKTDVWDVIWNNRDRLFSKQCASFIGYARTQANKYGIKGSRVAASREALELLKTFDKQKKLGEYDDLIVDHLKKFPQEFINIIEIPQESGQTIIKHLEVCNRKLPYTFKVKECVEIVQRLFDEYGKRALAAENNDGVDWKALSHAVRIGEQAIEFLRTSFITFPRDNAQELLDIKKGNVDYKKVAEKIEQLLIDVEKESDRSTLPEFPDNDWIDNFVYSVYLNEIKG